MNDGVAYMKGLEKFSATPGHQRIRALLDALGNPHEGFSTVHVAGTNGKGSTCAMTYSVLLASGVRAGLFSKPHLQVYRERMRAMGNLIPQRDLDMIIDRVRKLSADVEASGLGHPTEFETGLAVAFEWFRQVGVDTAVVETGMGGRLDSTNIIRPLVSVVTPIAIDHTERLGTTIESIAFEKAGIIKEGVPVVVAAEPFQPSSALAILRDTAAGSGSALHGVGLKGVIQGGWAIEPKGQDWSGGIMDITSPDGMVIRDVRVNLVGEHQLLNAALVWAACEVLGEAGLPVTEGTIRQGIASAVWPGRMETIDGTPRIMIDGTTNPHGAKALAKGLRTLLAGERGMRLHLVMGISIDKDPAEMMVDLLPMASSIALTKARSSRLGTHEPEDLAAVVQKLAPGLPVRVCTDAVEAVEAAVSGAMPGDLVCVCGSLYLVGEIRGIWREAE